VIVGGQRGDEVGGQDGQVLETDIVDEAFAQAAPDLAVEEQRRGGGLGQVAEREER